MYEDFQFTTEPIIYKCIVSCLFECLVCSFFIIIQYIEAIVENLIFLLK